MIDTTEKRQAELVKDSLGKEILKYLDDPEVNEVYINQDYSLRIDTISGRRKTDVILTSDTVALTILACTPAGYVSQSWA